MNGIIYFVITLGISVQLLECHVIVYRTFTDQLVEEFYDLPALFGPSLPTNGLRVRAVQSIPKDACEVPEPPPASDNDGPIPIVKWVLIIARTNCTFEKKIRNAQAANYDAAIVYNIGSDELERMSADNADGIKIPSVFVGETTGRYIIGEYLYDDGFTLLLNDELPFNLNHLIVPISILGGLCFIIMIVYMIYKCAREQRRVRQHRLPKKLLKKIPIIKFTKDQPYESCIICLEDYVEGERLRVLPCTHAYHCHCIDKWLTKRRRDCPICKRKVFARTESGRSQRRNFSSDSVSDSETDDTTPLLNPVENSNNHGTFSNTTGQNNRTENNIFNRPGDEDDAQVNTGRVNPFDRIPNLPPNLAQDLNGSRSFWNHPLIRFFKRRRTIENNNIRPDLIPTPHSESVAVNVNLPPQSASSNNILNTNLSGSFKDSDDEQIREESIYESVQSLSNINIVEEGSDSIFIQTPTQGGIRVVALPNTNFQNEDSRGRRHNSTNPFLFV